jgi:hypothetical protein
VPDLCQHIKKQPASIAMYTQLKSLYNQRLNDYTGIPELLHSILSPVRLPVSPPGQVALSVKLLSFTEA